MDGDRGPETYVYQAGIAAHHVLQAVGEETNRRGEALQLPRMEKIARAVCEKLIREGRSFEGEPEPPLRPDRVWEGRDIAIDYIASHAPEPGARYEHGMAVDEMWQPVDYSPDARLRCIADVVWVDEYEDEESVARTLVVRDYKTAWSTGPDSLGTLQMKIQSVLADIHYSEAEVLTIQVVNLRTWAVYSRDLYLGAEGREVLDEWRADIESTMRALDRQRDEDGHWPAIPGWGCAGCPYLTICREAQDWLVKYRLDNPEEGAQRYAILEAERKRLFDWLKRATDQGPIDLGNAVVGTVASERAAPTEAAYSRAWDEWTLARGDGSGFARAVGITSGNLNNLSKALYPGRENTKDREAFLAEVLTTKRVRRFGLHAKKEQEDAEDE